MSDFSEELPTILGPKRKRLKKEDKTEDHNIDVPIEDPIENRDAESESEPVKYVEPPPILPTMKLQDSHGNHMGQVVIYWQKDLGGRLIPCPMLLVTLNSNDSWQCQRFGDGMMNMYVTFATMYSEKPEHGCFTKIPKG